MNINRWNCANCSRQGLGNPSICPFCNHPFSSEPRLSPPPVQELTGEAEMTSPAKPKKPRSPALLWALLAGFFLVMTIFLATIGVKSISLAELLATLPYVGVVLGVGVVVVCIARLMGRRPTIQGVTFEIKNATNPEQPTSPLALPPAPTEPPTIEAEPVTMANSDDANNETAEAKLPRMGFLDFLSQLFSGFLNLFAAWAGGKKDFWKQKNEIKLEAQKTRTQKKTSEPSVWDWAKRVLLLAIAKLGIGLENSVHKQSKSHQAISAYKATVIEYYAEKADQQTFWQRFPYLRHILFIMLLVAITAVGIKNFNWKWVLGIAIGCIAAFSLYVAISWFTRRRHNNPPASETVLDMELYDEDTTHGRNYGWLTTTLTILLFVAAGFALAYLHWLWAAGILILGSVGIYFLHRFLNARTEEGEYEDGEAEHWWQRLSLGGFFERMQPYMGMRLVSVISIAGIFAGIGFHNAQGFTAGLILLFYSLPIPRVIKWFILIPALAGWIGVLIIRPGAH